MPTRIYLNDVYPYDIPDFKGEESEIINIEIKNPADQFWTKQTIPDFNKITKKEEIDWIFREEKRRKYGVHFMNNGVLTYINGKHYKFLQYYVGDFEGKDHPDFWEVHRLYFYFLEFSENDEFNFGDFTIKPRRCGFSQIHNSDAMEASMSGFNKKVGLISATLLKVKAVQFFPIRNAVAKYQYQFRPKFKRSGKKLLEKSLEFIDDDYTSDNGLNSGIYYSAPETVAFDGEKLLKLKVDEVLKMEGRGFEDVIAPQVKTMYLPHLNKIIGKLSLFSTMGTNDKTMRYCIAEGRELWDKSNYDEREENGKTTSGYLRYFVSCLDTLCIDKYGFADKEKAEKKYADTLKTIIAEHGEGSLKHITELREMPRTINDVFDSPKLGTLFNTNGRVSDRERVVLATPIKNRGYITGRFFEDVHNKVYFDTDAKWNNYGWKINLINIAKPNHIRTYNGVYGLQAYPEGAGGYDPVKLEEVISNHISQPAITLYKKYDHYSKTGIENQIIGTYVGRKDDLNEVSEQCALACRYFGFVIVPERNVMNTWFRENGYAEMVHISKYDGLRGIYMGTGKGKDALRDGIHLINEYIKKPKEGTMDIDYLETIPFEELLYELKTFEADRLNTHDLIASTIQAFLGAKQLKDTVLSGNKRVATGNVFWG